MPLLWRVLVTNAAVIVAAVLLLAVTPLAVHLPETWRDLIVLAAAVGAVLATNLALLRPVFEPLQRLARTMRDVDLLRPEPPPQLGGSSEVELLGTAFGEMVERLEGERADSMRRTLRAQEEERRRLARTLHDEIGQQLTAVILQLDALAKNSADGARSDLAEIQESVSEALDEIRRITRELRPVALDDLGLPSALVALCTRVSERTGLPISRRIANELPSLSDEAELVIYRVAQESLTNIVRHAHASRADVRLERVAGGVLLRVHDDGVGLGSHGPSGGGLRGMREWALLAHGRLEFESNGRGTTVRLRIPEEQT